MFKPFFWASLSEHKALETSERSGVSKGSTYLFHKVHAEFRSVLGVFQDSTDVGLAV